VVDKLQQWKRWHSILPIALLHITVAVICEPAAAAAAVVGKEWHVTLYAGSYSAVCAVLVQLATATTDALM
jgi:hypothetical protein